MNEVSSHYDKVSNAWRIIMGECQHFGFYESGNEDLDLASTKLIEKLLSIQPSGKTINQSSQVLDIGCGLGGTAFYINEKFQCKVTGIALGEQEIRAANQTSMECGKQKSVTFFQSDGTDTGFETHSFSHIVMLESSLLFPDKSTLFQEVFRLLKPGGVFLICDQVLVKKPNPKQMYEYGKHFETLQNCFGKTRTETIDEYQSKLKEKKFVDIRTEYITNEVKTSPSQWKKNAQQNREQVLAHFSEAQYQNFIEACDALDLMMKENFLGYGLVRATKASTT